MYLQVSDFLPIWSQMLKSMRILIRMLTSITRLKRCFYDHHLPHNHHCYHHCHHQNEIYVFEHYEKNLLGQKLNLCILILGKNLPGQFYKKKTIYGYWWELILYGRSNAKRLTTLSWNGMELKRLDKKTVEFGNMLITRRVNLIFVFFPWGRGGGRGLRAVSPPYDKVWGVGEFYKNEGETTCINL